MRIAIWDEPSLDILAAAIERSRSLAPASLQRGTRAQCRNWLVLGEVDVALVPTLTVFREPDLFDALPAVAVSSWNFPAVGIALRQPLGARINTVAFDPTFAQEVLVARIVLKEHYNVEPGFVPVDTASAPLLEAPADAVVLVNHLDQSATDEVARLDLGREWFELTNYPMVWGLFVAGRGSASSEQVRRLTTFAALAEQTTAAWLKKHPVTESMDTLLRENVRYRLDDLAVASFTALQDYLYYYLATDDLSPVSFYEVPESEDDTDETPLL